MIDRDEEFAEPSDQIGSVMVFENDHLRVWHIEIAPGERLPAHQHKQTYFWTATTAGKARSRYGDGRDIESEYNAGGTRYFDLTPETGFVHDLENIGDTVLKFVTVEFKNQVRSNASNN